MCAKLYIPFTKIVDKSSTYLWTCFTPKQWWVIITPQPTLTPSILSHHPIYTPQV